MGLGGQRQVVFVTGEAGIGKTTLLDAFQDQAARYPDLRIARGQCIEGFGGMEAYYPMLEAVGSLLRGAEDTSFIETLAKLAPTWLIQFPGLLKPERRESLQRGIMGSTRERMVREICETLESIAAQTPLLVTSGRSSLGRSFDAGPDLRIRPPQRPSEGGPRRHIPPRRCPSFRRPAKGTEAGFAYPPPVSRSCRGTSRGGRHCGLPGEELFR